MHNANIPNDRALPSNGKLIKSTVIAAITAGILLVTIVMPSEYGIDPTGFGKVTGLQRMGEIKVSLAKEAKDDAVIVAVEAEPKIVAETTATQTHEMTFTLAPDKSTEIKVTMVKGAKVNYIWETDGCKANFDVHGDSKALKINYHGYYKGSDVKREGTLEAAFDGNHGWFWRNRTKQPLTITIKTHGEYTVIKRY